MSNRESNGGKFIGCGVLVVACMVCLWTILYFSFRGEVVEVPNAHVGRVKTVSGFQTGVVRPSIFRLPSNWWGMTPSKLILAETSDNLVVEDIKALYIPADKLNLEFQVVGNFAVSSDDKRIDAIYDRLKPVTVQGNAYVEEIGFKQVYQVYGEQALRTTAQEIVAGYSIQYTLENLDKISLQIHEKVNERLASSPLVVKYCGLGTVQPPQLIVDAQEQAKKREIEIATANNQKQVALTKADAAYHVGLKNQEIELLEAETQVLSDLVVSDAVSEAYIAQRSLRVLAGLAKNPNATFVLSTKVFEDPGSMLGLSRMTLDSLKANSADRNAQLQEALRLIEAAKHDAAERVKKEAEEPKASVGAEKAK